MTHDQLRTLVGTGAVLAPLAHTLSDLAEAAGGGFSVPQLTLNYVAFLALPFVVLGLYAVQRPRADGLGLVGALCYAAAFVYFAGTTTYALARATPDYATLLDELGAAYLLHGALMVVGGVLFGVSVVRAAVLPRWSGIALAVGSGLNLLLATVPLPPIAQVLGSLVRNVALVGMGAALLRRTR